MRIAAVLPLPLQCSAKRHGRLMVRLRMDSRHLGHWPESGGKTDSRASNLRLHEQQPGMNGHSLDRRFTNNGFYYLRRIVALFSA